MLRPDFAAAVVAQEFAREAGRIALPFAVSAPAAGRDFRAMFNAVRTEVTDFIANGSDALPGSGVMAGATLSAEGRAQLARLQVALPGAGPSIDDAGSHAGLGAGRAQQQEFIASVAPWAKQTAARLGVSPELVTAHAALESGWGQRPLRGSDGGTTHNLFGVKTGSAWTGDVVRALTTEVQDGVPTRLQQDFRSYSDEASAFRDYADLLLGNPRYHSALNAGADARAFAQGLAQGRYATDPSYAHKLEQMVRQVRDIGVPAAGAAQDELLRGR